jgi:hypothetical protein
MDAGLVGREPERGDLEPTYSDERRRVHRAENGRRSRAKPGRCRALRARAPMGCCCRAAQHTHLYDRLSKSTEFRSWP